MFVRMFRIDEYRTYTHKHMSLIHLLRSRTHMRTHSDTYPYVCMSILPFAHTRSYTHIHVCMT